MNNPLPLSTLDIDQDVRRRLSHSLQSIDEGNSEVYRSPFLNDLSADEILAKFDKVMMPHLDSLPFEMKEMELSNRAKFGPRSIAKPWSDRKESLLNYFADDNSDTANIPMIEEARSRLTPLSLSNSAERLKKNTSSGMPYLKQKGIVKDKTLDNAYRLLERNDPCVLFTRTQESGKTRNIWGYPMVNSLLEMSYFYPLLEYHKRNSPWQSSLGGPASVDTRITHLFAKKGGKQVVSIDFSAYDASVKSNLQALAWKYISSAFQPKYREILDEIAKTFGTIGIITPPCTLR